MSLDIGYWDIGTEISSYLLILLYFRYNKDKDRVNSSD